MEANKFVNINTIKEKENITIFKNNFNDNVWDFTEYNKSLSSRGEKIKFDIEFNGIKLLDQKELLNEIKSIIYNRFKAGVKIRTNIGFFNSLKKFIKYLFEFDKTNFNTVTPFDLENYKKRVNSRSDLVAVRNCFIYKTGGPDSIRFYPYKDQNLKKIFSSNKQTEILEDQEWKKICVFCEKKISSFLDNIKREEEINEFFYNYYNERGNFNNIRGSFKNRFKEKIGEWKKRRMDVQVCSAMLIQAYTGMRLSEVLSLKRGCLESETHIKEKEKIKIFKINGRTYKYKPSNGDSIEEGIDATWYCPEFINKSISALEFLNEIYFKVYDDKRVNSLFINLNFYDKICYKTDLNFSYNKILKENKIINFDINSHMFRRTLARFFAKSIIDVPVEVLKEQYKHFSKSITHYYMKDSEKADNSFIELMESYSEDIIEGKKYDKKSFENFVQKNINEVITTAKNLDELTKVLDSGRLTCLNEYMATTGDIKKPLSPIESLSCKGVVILPDIHRKYWEEMLVLYEELISFEPDSYWYEKEKLMIENVVKKLKNNEIYISKGDKE